MHFPPTPFWFPLPKQVQFLFFMRQKKMLLLNITNFTQNVQTNPVTATMHFAQFKEKIMPERYFERQSLAGFSPQGGGKCIEGSALFCEQFVIRMPNSRPSFLARNLTDEPSQPARPSSSPRVSPLRPTRKNRRLSDLELFNNAFQNKEHV